jgi:hypothetical protein
MAPATNVQSPPAASAGTAANSTTAELAPAQQKSVASAPAGYVQSGASASAASRPSAAAGAAGKPKKKATKQPAAKAGAESQEQAAQADVEMADIDAAAASGIGAASASAREAGSTVAGLLRAAFEPTSCAAVLAQLDSLPGTEALDAIACVVFDKDFDGEWRRGCNDA